MEGASVPAHLLLWDKASAYHTRLRPPPCLPYSDPSLEGALILRYLLRCPIRVLPCARFLPSAVWLST